MKKAMLDYIKRGAFDELYTPAYAIKPLLNYIPNNVKTVWCPCDALESNIVQELLSFGYDIIYSHKDEGKDFFKCEPEGYDMIITNPPYSLKDDIIKRCYELKKPFALLLPMTALEGTKRHKLFKNGIGLIALDKRCDFNSKGSCWFNTSWFVHSQLTDGRLFFEILEK